jgi:hypothetical protein
MGYMSTTSGAGTYYPSSATMWMACRIRVGQPKLALTWCMTPRPGWYQHIGIQRGDGDWHACSFNLCDYPLIHMI